MKRLAILCVAGAALIAPPAAHAGADDVLRDCGDDGSLDKSYAKRDLREAVRTIPADLAEYSDCRAVIGAAAGRSGPPASAGRGARAAVAATGTAGPGGAAAARAAGPSSRRAHRGSARKRAESPRAESGRRVVGRLLAGASSGQPRTATAAAGGRTAGRGVPGWAWSLLALGALLALGGAREGLGGHLGRRAA